MARLKVRSRKGGSAVPLTDDDKRLLNLMQGSFPIEPRPYAAVARELGTPEAAVLARVSELIDERIIRQVTPIFDTRALGYESMLVAARVDPENPWRPAKLVNAHPGVSHNYLRNHDFNMWFTIAVEEDSELGLEGTLDVLARETEAESVRMLPTIKLFKIRMDLEMEGGTDMLAVAARVDPENPWRPAKLVNAHPGVSHNYLRNHDFNMWFTIAVEEDSELGLEGTLDVLARETEAESVRMLPTITLFKIRMDLEMEGGTDKLAVAAQEVAPAPIEKVPYDELDKAVIRATQGDLPVVSEPYAAASRELGMTEQALVEHLLGMQERGILRRVAAILFHRRAGFSANGMGVWRVPDDQISELGARMASFRGISHCYQRPTYEDWPYSVFTMAHGRSKEECDAILDAIAADTGISDRATLYSSTEFKKVRLLYFTDDYKQWERDHAGV